MKLRVELAPDAREQIAELGRWWRKNRPKNRGLFREELRAAIDMLSERPEAGPIAEDAGAGVHSCSCRAPSITCTIGLIGPVEGSNVLLVWHTAREKRPYACRSQRTAVRPWQGASSSVRLGDGPLLGQGSALAPFCRAHPAAKVTPR
jgi:plasmid stabilization system protein ParE